MKIDYLARRMVMAVALVSVAVLLADAMAQPTPRPKRSGRTYKVRIDSAPQQATIYLEDKQYGVFARTPWEGRLQQGSWKVIIEKEGYEPQERTFKVARKRATQDVFVPLVKKVDPAQIDVRADADKNAFGAEVWLDGQLQGQIPVILKLDDGRHLVEIRKEGFQAFQQWVNVKEGDRVNILPTLKEVKKDDKGAILVEADVPDAEVWLDGNKHADTTPTLVNDIPAGPHVIEVRKAPAMPWRQQIEVKANKTVKVSAQLQATIGGAGGSARVLADVDGAKVFLDGTEMGTVPLDIKDIKPGEHILTVKAPGYMPNEKRITVGAGSAEVHNVKLQPESKASGGTLKIVSPVPEAAVFVDGERIGTVPQTREVSTGEHYVVVSKPGYKTFEQKIRIDPGQSITVSAQLSQAGALQILSTPAGAEVLIDGEVVGQTPVKKEDVDVGEHVVTIRYPDYYDFEKQVAVKGGEREIISAKLEMIDTGPTAAQLEREQRGLTSYGARSLPKLRSTLDAAIGYPYFFEGKITVGAGELAGFPFDAGVMARTFFSRTELGLVTRLTLADREPFSFALTNRTGGGSNLFDDSRRSTFFFDLGALASLSGLGSVTITGGAFINYYNDRHCPELVDDPMNPGTLVYEGDPVDMCEGYLARARGAFPQDFTAEEKRRVDGLLGLTDQSASMQIDGISDRHSGVRILTMLAVEVAIRQQWNVWGIIEGAPFQDERPAFTDVFNGAQLSEDIGTYFRFGMTYKF